MRWWGRPGKGEHGGGRGLGHGLLAGGAADGLDSLLGPGSVRSVHLSW
jgi:hypothetical protein